MSEDTRGPKIRHLARDLISGSNSLCKTTVDLGRIIDQVRSNEVEREVSAGRYGLTRRFQLGLKANFTTFTYPRPVLLYNT